MPFKDDTNHAAKSFSQSPELGRSSSGLDDDLGGVTPNFLRRNPIWLIDQGHLTPARIKNGGFELFCMTQQSSENRPKPTMQEFDNLPKPSRDAFLNAFQHVIQYLLQQAPADVQEVRVLALDEAARVAEKARTASEAARAIREKIRKV